MRAENAPHGFQSHALFERRVRHHTVVGDEFLASKAMRLRMLFLSRLRVPAYDVRGRGGDRFHPLATFLSLLHVQVHERPPSLLLFSFGPSCFNFILFPDFWYISFDFVRVGPPIGIDSMSSFQFGPPSFNFRIALKKINLFSTIFLISSVLSFN